MTIELLQEKKERIKKDICEWFQNSWLPVWIWTEAFLKSGIYNYIWEEKVHVPEELK